MTHDQRTRRPRRTVLQQVSAESASPTARSGRTFTFSSTGGQCICSPNCRRSRRTSLNKRLQERGLNRVADTALADGFAGVSRCSGSPRRAGWSAGPAPPTAGGSHTATDDYRRRPLGRAERVWQFWPGRARRNPHTHADERSVEVRLRHQLSSTCLDALGLLRA